MPPALLPSLALAFAAGIALAEALGPAPPAVALAAAGSLLAAWLALRTGARGATLAVLGAALACGLLRVAVVPPAPAAPPLLGPLPAGPRVGLVREGPWPIGDGAACDLVLADGQTVVRLYSDGSLAHVAPGDTVAFRSGLVPLLPAGNPGAPTQRAGGPAWTASLRGDADLVRLSGAAPDLLGRLARGRDRLARRVQQVAGPREGGVIAALALGARRLVPAAERDRLAATGTAHALAVSGLHLGLVGLWLHAIVGWLLRRSVWLVLRVRLDRIQALLTLVGVVAFTLVTGAATATLRALLMAAVLLTGRLLGRRASGSGALSVAVLGLLATDPALLSDVSFQLSVSAVAAILAAAPLGERWTARIVPGVTAGPLLGRAGRALVSGAWVSLAASLGTAPVLAAHLHRIAPLSILANFVAVPLLALVVLPLALLGVALTALLPAGAAPTVLAVPAAAVEAWLDAIAALATIAPDPSVGPTWAVAALALGAALLLLAARSPHPGRLALAGAALCALPLLPPPPAAPAGGFAATILDVCHGSATLVRLPDGATVLVDGGGRADGSPGAGASRVVPALRALGVRRVDLMVMSHGHADHAAGLVAVAAAFPVEELWTPGPSATEPARRLERLVQARGGRVVPVDTATPPRVVGGVRLAVLWPPDSPERAPPRRGDGENDRSVVVHVAAAGGSLLLPADIEAPAEQALLRAGVRPAATVAVAPHHGSATSSSPAFVAAVRPRAVVWSRGPGGRPALPARPVAGRWRAVGALAFDTVRDGAVEVRADARALTICAGRTRRTRHPAAPDRTVRCLAVGSPDPREPAPEPPGAAP